MKKTNILVVDDEPETLKYVGANLRAHGYTVLTAQDGRTACSISSEAVLDLIILDIMLPDIDGLLVCQTIRQQSPVPIIVLSARGQERDIVHALDVGADDYLTKPFGVEELLARVRFMLRRMAQTMHFAHAPLTIGDLEIDFNTQVVTLAGQTLHLTRTEYALLEQLAIYPGRVLTHRMLLQSIWGPEYSDEAEYLWAYVRRLRRKFGDRIYIMTQPGVGYYLANPLA